MIDWELSIQLSDGAFPGHFGEAGSRPVIFNTGQIMHGLIAGYYPAGAGRVPGVGCAGRSLAQAAAGRRWLLAEI